MPFENDSFDAVIGISTLHHLDMAKALPEINRVLKKEGLFVFTEPNMLNPVVFLEIKIKWLRERLFVSENESAFLRWNLKRILNKNGFSNIRIIPFDMLHPQLPERMMNAFVKVSGVIEKTPILNEFLGSLQIRANKVVAT
jgi:SAM-dependent methyltransferase